MSFFFFCCSKQCHSSFLTIEESALFFTPFSFSCSADLWPSSRLARACCVLCVLSALARAYTSPLLLSFTVWHCLSDWLSLVLSLSLSSLTTDLQMWRIVNLNGGSKQLLDWAVQVLTAAAAAFAAEVVFLCVLCLSCPAKNERARAKYFLSSLNLDFFFLTTQCSVRS